MKIPPIYTITPDIIELLSKIDANHMFLVSYNISGIVKEKIQRVNLLKSSLFSARIEGNPLHMDDVIRTSDEQKKKEVFNILKAISWIDKNVKVKSNVTAGDIIHLHAMVMKDIGASGSFRTEPSAIFNMAGVAIYMASPPPQIKELIGNLLRYINSNQERFPLISAFVAHLIFEKIHPFLDGNGRVGRLLILLVLKSKGYNFGFAVPFEEYLDSHKEEYYYHLDQGLRQTNEYLVFMLQSFYEQTEIVKQTVDRELTKQKEILLLPPRQEEIYLIIKDHKIVSFDFIKRRFLKVPKRTLRYDLKKLQDAGYIVKIGKTRGSYYAISSLRDKLSY